MGKSDEQKKQFELMVSFFARYQIGIVIMIIFMMTIIFLRYFPDFLVFWGFR